MCLPAPTAGRCEERTKVKGEGRSERTRSKSRHPFGQPVPPLHPPRCSCCHPHPPQWTRIATSAARLRSQQNPESSDRSHHHSCSYTVLLYSCSRHPGTLDWTSLRKYRISRYRRNLQNRNSAAAGIAIRFGPNILLKCDRRQTGPKYPCTGLDDGINLRSHSIALRSIDRPPHLCFLL